MEQIPDPPKRGRGRPHRFELPPIPPEVVEHVVSLAAETIVPDDEHDPASTFDEGLTELERQQLREVLAEFAQREMEALHLFEPMPEQERFFSSNADERVALGGNRGGKTTVACVEIARAVTGQDPHDKYPKRDGRIILVGKDLTHCSKVFFKKLFKPGAFQIIRDAETGKWRTFRPNDPRDNEREDEARPAPPLISTRFYDYKQISWENKKEELPKTITLKNGWQMFFFSSLGIPPQGWDVDMVAFDEEIEHPLWYPEMSARLLDRRKKNKKTGKVKSGKFVWSATPQAGTVQLYQLVHRAEEEADDAVKLIEVYRFGMLDNAFMSQHSKDTFVNKFKDNEEEYRVRVLGEFALLGTRVYGEFVPGRAGGRPAPHGMDSFPIPHEWTRYASLDPGRQVCAILFAAVPPPNHPEAGRVYFYDELYIKRADAASVAKAVKAKIGDARIHKWFIDARAGRITEIGSGVQVEEQYRRSFVKEKVFGVTGQPNGFVWSTGFGADDVKAGIEAVRGGLHLDEDGRAKWVVFRDKLKNFCWEAEIYSYKRLPSGLVTDEPIKHDDHLMDNWRYLAMAKLAYHKPPSRKVSEGYTTKALAAKEKRRRQRGEGSDSINLF